VAFKLNDVGMVTDAVWEDIDNDSKKDLIVVGDWMAPKYLKRPKIGRYKSNLTEYPGFGMQLVVWI
jgi:hypothetical protein